MSYTNDALVALKAKYDDPAVFVGGDFNRRDLRLATVEHPDLKQVEIGATRGSAALDIIATNINDSMIDCGTTEAIRSECGTSTDHLTPYASFRMPRVPTYNIEKYTYRHITEEAHHKFGELLENADWRPVLESNSSNKAMAALHQIFQEGLNVAYELKTSKKKTSEPVWMTEWLRKDIESRRTVFKTDEKWSARWQLLKKRRRTQLRSVRRHLTTTSLASLKMNQTQANFSTT